MSNLRKSFDNDAGAELSSRSAPRVGVAEVRLAYGLACDVEHEDRRMRVDLPAEDGGGATGPHPGQLMRASLGACLVMGYRLWAARRAVPLEDVQLRIACEFDAHGELGVEGEEPVGWQRVILDVTLVSSAPAPALQALVETVHRHSPMLALLSADVERELRVRFVDPGAEQA